MDEREEWQNASFPPADVAVPARVRELAGDAELHPVWLNNAGGLTFRTSDGRFIKYGMRNLETSMAGEAERLGWAAPYTRVPQVLAEGRDATHEWLVTGAMPGRSAVDPHWRATPAVAVAQIGRGLRALHDALPVADCPFEWSVASRVANARERGIALEVSDIPPVDRLVVCHGDACAPNTLIDDHGAWSAHVDLGALGLADRWADIAVAAMSCDWNFGPGWQDALVEAYGVAPDPERMRFYQELWNAT